MKLKLLLYQGIPRTEHQFCCFKFRGLYSVIPDVLPMTACSSQTARD